MRRLGQLWQAFRATADADARFVPLFIAASLLGFAIPFVVVGILLSSLIIGIVLGVLGLVVGGLSVFGRRATAAQIAAIEGQPGAAAAVMHAMRGQWFVTPAVAVAGKAVMVHRAVGRPGIVLVAEGRGKQAAMLLQKERKRMKRVSGDAPVRTFVVGDGDGDDVVELGKLTLTLAKLPRSLKKGQVPELARKLDALGGDRIPIPKGPIPGVSRKRLR
jgi:hypothetical protein